MWGRTLLVVGVVQQGGALRGCSKCAHHDVVAVGLAHIGLQRTMMVRPGWG